MKIIAILMVISGILIGGGGALEFGYYGPEARQFWAGVIATPAGFFFAVAGIVLWRRGSGARRVVLIGALVLAIATVAATALRVMGLPATLVGMLSSLGVAAWTWKSRAMAA